MATLSKLLLLENTLSNAQQTKDVTLVTIRRKISSVHLNHSWNLSKLYPLTYTPINTYMYSSQNSKTSTLLTSWMMFHVAPPWCLRSLSHTIQRSSSSLLPNVDDPSNAALKLSCQALPKKNDGDAETKLFQRIMMFYPLHIFWSCRV